MVPSFWTDEISNVGDSISNVGFEPSRIPNEPVEDNSAISPGVDGAEGYLEHLANMVEQLC